MDAILNLPEDYARFSQTEKDLFDSVYFFSVNTGRTVIPEGMTAWAKEQFGSIEAIENQSILRITNKLTLESTLFNPLRASRPTHKAPVTNLKNILADAKTEPFADVAGLTPEDTFGRIKGRHDITASNVAKYDAHHGLVIFNKADPVHLAEEETVGHFNTALKWIAKANEQDPGAVYPVIAWNALWKAGASLVHGHLQVLLAKGEHYAAMELFKTVQDSCKRNHQRPYFETLFEIHSRLGLGIKKEGIQVMSHLTPKKEKEIMLISSKADDGLFSTIHRVVGALTKDMGVESFNLAVIMPPLDGSWGDFPVITRIIDRGALSNRTTDVAVMELLLNQNVVASDPVKVWSAVKPAL